MRKVSTSFIQYSAITLMPVLGIVFGATQSSRGSTQPFQMSPSRMSPRAELNDRLDHVTNDTALYQRLSDINAVKAPAYRADPQPLRDSEHLYAEKLPSLSQNPRLSGAMNRVEKQTYRR